MRFVNLLLSPSNHKRFVSSALLIFCCLMPPLCLIGCSTNEPLKGVVARINGKIVTINDLDAVIAARHAQFSQSYENSLTSLQNYYADALTVLIINHLIHDELERKNIPVASETADKELELLLKKDALTEESVPETAPLSRDEWRKLAHNHLESVIFLDKVLMPEIKISKEEVERYYNKHQEKFMLPEIWELRIAVSSDRNFLEEFCAHKKTPLQKINIYTQHVVANELEKHTFGSKSLKSGVCTSIIQNGDVWTAVMPEKKYPAQKKELIEVYELIENLLKRERLPSEFGKWLEKNSRNLRIETVPALKSVFQENALSPAS